MTLGELIEIGAQQMHQARVQFGQGTLSAWDEARWLTLAILNYPVDSPENIHEQLLSATQISLVQAALDRRIRQRVPTAYITGMAWLKGYGFAVDPRVIIPRSFIAELLVQRLATLPISSETPSRILDMCTGSGCLAIIAADIYRQASIDAADLSAEALAVAQANVDRYGMADRIRLVQSDVFSALTPNRWGPYELILANPPYVPAAKERRLPDEFRAEPRMALIAEDRGMAIVRRLLSEAAHFLAPGGLLIIEIGHERRSTEALLRREFPGLKAQWIRTQEQFDNVFVIRQEQLIQHPWSPPQ
ncbi:MAG: 50S ribosomal protein L3 N(5)-glutamine methyltransferase [Betaproteobacteria bacterium]|nr:50S ribosomal protein L3 N(5)-glutamine methyltransferase [Betaproteobacteria bacterium]